MAQRVYQFDQRQKKLIQNELPPEVRGQAIGKGPLPFLFNAKADDIKQRFWLRIVTPKDTKGEYWLEAVPKTQEDAANFKMIHIIIDETDYLPKAMVLFDTSYVAGVRPSRTTFQFNEREVNFSVLAEQLNLFHREFYEPKLPAGLDARSEPRGSGTDAIRKTRRWAACPTQTRAPRDVNGAVDRSSRRGRRGVLPLLPPCVAPSYN